MDGFLVLVNLDSECAPVRMFDTQAKAVAYAQKLRGIPPKVQAIWPWDDYRTRYNSLVVGFSGGQPFDVEFVRWDDDPDDLATRPKGRRGLAPPRDVPAN